MEYQGFMKRARTAGSVFGVACALISVRVRAEDIPGGNAYVGLGFHLSSAIAPNRGPGFGFSLEAQLESQHFLLGGTLMLAGSSGGDGMIFLGARSAVIFTAAESSPFVGFGIGYMETGALEEGNTSTGLGLNGEVGFLLFRSRRFGRFSVSLQAFFPTYDECPAGNNCSNGHWRPWASLSMRLLL